MKTRSLRSPDIWLNVHFIGSVPTSPLSPIRIKSSFQEELPEIHSLLSAGAHYLELGCGIGGGLLSLLRAYPKVTAVAVELAADLLEEVQRTITAFDLDDRITLHHGDASVFEATQAFDVVWWSQFFFPEDSRKRTLQVAFRALKPGGFLLAPLQTEPSVLETHLHSEQGKIYTLQRVRFRAWEIPPTSAQDLQDEMEEAGFISPRLTYKTGGRRMIAQRP